MASLSIASELKKVTLQLRWDHQFQFAGYYAAKWNGYYADAGLDVTIRSGVGPDGKVRNVVEEIEQGNADFGVGSADILLGIDRGVPLVVLASIFQRSAAEFYAKETTELRTLGDLGKLKVARSVNDLVDLELQAMLHAEGINPAHIKPYPHQPGIAQLVDGRVDVIPGYSLGVNYEFQMRGLRMKVLRPVNYGVDFYGDALFSHQRVIDQGQDVVERFRAASLKGWHYALEHPEEIADRIASDLPRTTPVFGGDLKDYNRFQISHVTSLAMFPIVELGNVNPLRWLRMNQMLADAGVIKRDIDIRANIGYDPEAMNRAQDAKFNKALQRGSAVGAGALLITLFFVWLLRRQVKRATQALRLKHQEVLLSQESLSITLHSIGDAVIATDAMGRVTRLNATAQRLTGWPLDDAVGLSLTEVFHIVNAETKEKVPNPVELVMAQGRVVGLANHTVLIARDGKWHHISDSAAPIRNAVGDIVGVVLVFSDVTAQYKADEALRHSESQYRALVSVIPDMIFTNRREGEFVSVHASDEQLLLTPAATFLGRNVAEVLPAAIAEPFLSAFASALDSQSGQVVNYMRNVGGLDRYFEARVVPATDDSVISIVRDVTERYLAQESMRISAIAFESQEGILVTNKHNRILRVNGALCAMTGFLTEELVGQDPKVMSSGQHDGAFYEAMWTAVVQQHVWHGEVCNRRKDGELYPAWLAITAVKNDHGEVTHYVGTYSDISERKAAEEQIQRLAFYDSLTGLPNRRLLMDRLGHALASGERHDQRGALLFVDLDDFKTINDTKGHDQGDLLLEQVAERLRTCVRDGDTVARLGGDEFVVMLEHLNADAVVAAEQAETVGKKILTTLGRIYQLDGHPCRSTPSIGITLFADQNESVEELLKRADMAMYEAKAAGRNTLRFFDPQMQTMVTSRAALEADLREGLAGNQFVLYYQIQMGANGHRVGAEALIRWQHPQRGLVSPSEFISVAEETGLILPIGQWVLEAGCRQLAQWGLKPETAHMKLAINVSAKQFHQSDFVAQVQDVLQRTGANARCLKLELTESMLVQNLEDVINKMKELRMHGVGFSLDDFGTGYSSLAYLKRLPLEQLKIDQSFVRDILIDPDDATIARTIVALGHSLGLTVIAEGVETAEQRDALASMDCDAYQGYHFGRPVPADVVMA